MSELTNTNEKERLAKDKSQAVDIVFLSLLDCSNSSLTREDIRGNAVAIISNLCNAGIINFDAMESRASKVEK